MKKKQTTHEEYKLPSISPFDFVNSIHHTKEDLIVDEWSEKQYNPFIINKALSYGADTVIYVNEMNSRPHIDKKLQYHFLINIIKPKKRFNKWLKSEKIEAIDVIKEYYGYNNEKAHQVYSILSLEQIQQMKQQLNKGGLQK